MPVGNMINKEVVKYFLKENLNIEADISIGFLGMGIGSYNNTYMDLTEKRPLTHAEVIKRVKNVAY